MIWLKKSQEDFLSSENHKKIFSKAQILNQEITMKYNYTVINSFNFMSCWTLLRVIVDKSLISK